jgi:hypothetical protein
MSHATTLAVPESRHSAKAEIPAFQAKQSLDELKAMGKALRDKCPRDFHAEWKPPHKRPD